MLGSSLPNPFADDTDVPPEQRAAMSGLPDRPQFNHWIGERVGDLVTSHPRNRPFLAVAGFQSVLAWAPNLLLNQDCESLNERALQQAMQHWGASWMNWLRAIAPKIPSYRHSGSRQHRA